MQPRAHRAKLATDHFSRFRITQLVQITQQYYFTIMRGQGEHRAPHCFNRLVTRQIGKRVFRRDQPVDRERLLGLSLLFTIKPDKPALPLEPSPGAMPGDGEEISGKTAAPAVLPSLPHQRKK